MRMLPRLARENYPDAYARFKEDPTFDEDQLLKYFGKSTAFPATGFPRVTREELMKLREKLIWMMNPPPDASEFVALNVELDEKQKIDFIFGLWLSEISPEYPRADLGDPHVWDFITLILLPDYASRRFPVTAPQGRFRGGDRRHVFQRIWHRHVVFGKDFMLQKAFRLGEDTFGAILERKVMRLRPHLALMVAEKILAFSNNPEASVRNYTRGLTRQLRLMSGLIDIDDDNRELLKEIVEACHDRVISSSNKP